MWRGGAKGLERFKRISFPVLRHAHLCVLSFADGVNDGAGFNLQTTVLRGVFCRLVVTMEHLGG